MAVTINVSKEIISANTSRLEPLPWKVSQQQREKEWLEEMTERADRSCADPEVQFSVGQHHFVHQDYQLALKYFEKAAGEAKRGEGCIHDNNSLQAKYQLGVMYYDGLGVKEDHAKGFAFMLEVAKSQSKKESNIVPSAQYNMGRAYFMGYGVPQSDEEAVKWWCSAGSLGNDPSSVRANNTLGLFYSRPESLNANQAYKYHSKAAECKNLESTATVGLMLIHGYGCTQSQSDGVNWLKASALLDQPAQPGSIYGRGLLSRQYYNMKLFSKAAETALSVSELDHLSSEGIIPLTKLDSIGAATGCFVLARCLQLGQAVRKNEPEAMVYYEKAKRLDINVVIEMHKQLTHGQL